MAPQGWAAWALCTPGSALCGWLAWRNGRTRIWVAIWVALGLLSGGLLALNFFLEWLDARKGLTVGQSDHFNRWRAELRRQNRAGLRDERSEQHHER